MNTLSILEENKRLDYHLCLRALAVSIQDESRHRAFKPGDIWFLATNGVSPRVKKYQHVMPLWEILNGTAEAFQEVFGDQWLGKVGKANHPPFHLFEKRDIGKVWFVTVKQSSEFSEYGSDTNMPSGDGNNLAIREKYPIVFKRIQREIEHAIELNVALRSRIAQLVKKDLIVEDKSSTHSPIAKRIISPSASTSGASPVAATPIAAPQRQLAMVAITPTTATGPLAKSLRLMSESIERLSRFDPADRKSSKKELKYLAHESMKMLSDDTANVVETNPKAGGKTTTWVKLTTNKGGTSRAALSRQFKQLETVIKATHLSENVILKDKTLKKVHSKHHSKPLFVFRKNKVLITPNPKDQNKLRQAGGMTDRQYIAFDNMLKDVTGFSVLDQKNTLAKMVEGIMYDFTVHNLAVVVSKQQVNRQAFLVDRINDVVLQCIVSLYEKGLLLDSSILTTLDDDYIIVRFGGDKGGSFMKFKFGLTIMNSVNVHSPDAFEICCTLDASDTYHNLCVLFGHYKEEMDFYFSTIRPPRMLMVLDGMNSDDVLCSATYNELEKGLLETAWDAMQEVEMAADDDSARSIGGPFQIRNETKLEVLYLREGETCMAWGLRFWNVGLVVDEATSVILQFKVPIDLLSPLSMVNRGLYVVLGGDIEFLHTILGLQGCSATYPCFVCEVKLSDLHSRQNDPTEATVRSHSRMLEQLEAVEKAGKTEKAKKEAAKKNGSKLRPHILPVETSRLLLPPLHMILGIVMKLWYNLIKALQEVDKDNNIQRRLLTAVRDTMMRHIAMREEEIRYAKETIETLEKKKKEAYENLARETLQTRQAEYNHEAYLVAKKLHNEACKAFKEAKDAWKKLYDKKYLDAVKDVLDDLNIYLKNRQGKYESVLEAVISTDPINAKHNPFYSGSFNGNDCQRLMHNFELLFDSLRTKANEAMNEEEKEKVFEIANKHQVIWDAFNTILPILRSKEKIETESEIQSFLDAINDFWVAYIENCDGSVTTKIHLLVMHAKWYLRTYGTIGFFTEDALESIHAIVNRLAKTYASLDKTRRGTQILRAMASRKSEMLDRVQEETKKYGEKGKQRKRARQGSKPDLQYPREESKVEKAIDEALADFFGSNKTQTELTLQLTESDNPFKYPSDTALTECELCRSGLSQDVFIPKTLSKLHHLVVHQEVEDKQKSSTSKKQK